MLSHLIHAGLGGCDGIDSELDKDFAELEQTEPFIIDTPFGFETVKWKGNLADAIGILNTCFSDFSSEPLKKRNAVMKELKDIYGTALGENSYPCNDVTIWAHSYSVAAMTKSLLAKVIIESGTINNGAPYKLPKRLRKDEKVKGKNTTDFTFVKVVFDREYLWSTSQKAGDVIGIADQVLKLQEAIRSFVECELLVGNEVYRDQEQQIFLIPRLGTWLDEHGKPVLDESLHAEFEQNIEDALYACISKHAHDIGCPEIPFGVAFASLEQQAGESVSDRILSRSASLLREETHCRQKTDITDVAESGKGRCVVCRFRIVGTSREQREAHICPSCHARRTDEEVSKRRNIPWEHITSDLQKLIPKNSEENRLALVSLFFDLRPLNDGSVFNKVEGEKKEKPVHKNSSPGRLHRSWEALRLFLSDCRSIVYKECESLLFPITLEASPDRMEFIIRGAKADQVISAIYNEYEKRFGKFRDCLPFSVGCVFFYRKFPLYVVMDAVRGMRNSFSSKRTATLVVKDSGCDDSGEVILSLLEEDQDVLGQPASWTKWRIDSKLSNKTQTDTYHCRFGDELLKDIAPGHRVEVSEGYFDFILADSSQTRHAFSASSRSHHILGKRPLYPVSVIPDFERLWCLLKKLNTNQVSSIEGFLVDKMMAWGDYWTNDPDAARGFCRLILFSPNAFGKRKKDKTYALLDSASNEPPLPENCDKQILENAAYNGLLLDVIDFYKHLQKLSVKTH